MSTGLRAGTNNDGYLQVNGTDVLTALSSGKIGIGTSTPTADIQLETSAYPTLKIQNTSSASGFPVFQLIDNRTNGVSFNIENGRDAGSLNFRDNTSTADRLTITSDGKVRLPDNGKLTLGAGDDLQIWSDNTDQYIRGEQNQLIVRSNNLKLQSYLGESYIHCAMNYDVSLYYDNSKKFETTDTGAKITGALEVTQEYPTTRPTLDLNFAATKTLDRRITFTRDSVGTYIDENRLVKYASNNVPRFDHDPTTGESLGLLIERERTNILGLSTDLTDNNGTDWDAVNGTITVNQTTAPDGTTTAASFTASAGNAEHSVVFAELVPTGSVTASVWVKPNTYSIVSFVLYGEPNSTVSYNLSTKTVYNQLSNVSRATITEYPNGWYRISATMNCTVSNSRAYRFFASTGNFNAGGSESFYYWGPQVESGSFETSYIPTYVSNTSATRASDSAIMTGTNFTDWYNQSEGTFYVESNSQPEKAGKKFINLDDNADGTGLYEMIEMATQQVDKVNIFSYDGQVVQSDIRVTPATTGRFKAAAALKNNDVQIAVDGTLGTADTSASQPSNIDRMIIGNYSSGNYTIDCPIARIAYYNTRLSNSQLQGLTQQ